MSFLRIIHTVGLKGVNNPEDVKVVQAGLNKLLDVIPPTKALSVDGVIGPQPELSNTVSAIKLFQRKIVGMVRPDGKVDVNGRTHRKMNEVLSQIEATNDSLTLSEEGTSLLKQVECFRSEPYDDQTGKCISHWIEGATIGYGHLIDEQEWYTFQTCINEQQASELFEKDLAPFIDEVKKRVTVTLTQQQFDALVILVFNIGGTNFKRSSLLKLINDPQVQTSYPNLESAWKAWKKSQGKDNKGLINRRNCEWNIYDKGVYKAW